MRNKLFLEFPSKVDEELYNAIISLLPQVTLKKPLPTREDIITILSSDSSKILTARYPDMNGQIVGMLSCVYYNVPSGKFGHLDDVVVDSNYRRKGIAKALIEKALNFFKEINVHRVDLTSNPSRIEANQLYFALGFKKRNTNSFYKNL
ncbi:GNAT family N-acetyltransferase [Chloroflexota bacterium]